MTDILKMIIDYMYVYITLKINMILSEIEGTRKNIMVGLFAEDSPFFKLVDFFML